MDGIQDYLDGLRASVVAVGHDPGLVAIEEHVYAGVDREDGPSLKAVDVPDREHLQRIRDNDSVVAHLLAQKPVDDPGGEAARELRIQLRMGHPSREYGVQDAFVDEISIGIQLG